MEILHGPEHHAPETYDDWFMAINAMPGVRVINNSNPARAARLKLSVSKVDTPKELSSFLGSRVKVEIDGNYDDGFAFTLKGRWPRNNRSVVYSVAPNHPLDEPEVKLVMSQSTLMFAPVSRVTGMGSPINFTAGRIVEIAVESDEGMQILNKAYVSTLEAATRAQA